MEKVHAGTSIKTEPDKAAATVKTEPVTAKGQLVSKANFKVFI